VDAETKHWTLTMPFVVANKNLAASVCFALGTVGCATVAQTAPVRWLSVDMPHGGCSLTVGDDGKTAIHFGASARWVEVAQGTFDFERLARTLTSMSRPQSVRTSTGSPVGSVSLPDREALLFIDDYDTVRSLLQRAWNARLTPTSAEEAADHAWVARTCALK
jgi:hypothetical protein